MGKVYLVGAGLGTVDSLTVRAHQLLLNAEVLIYDALVDAQLLTLVSPTCLKLDVGKRGGQPSRTQAEINQLLVEYGQQGKRVVRLKSGDPFIFGRTTSEIQALQAAGCEFEIIPGLSSALAAPLLAGIPLTDPVLSRGFMVVTAHEPNELDWQALARFETVVFLMGGRTLPEIIEQLIRHGRSPLTSIAIIRWAGTSQQQIWTGQLHNILAETLGESLSPAVIVIGEVVKLRQYLQISNSSLTMCDLAVTQPLAHQRILVTRSAGQSGEFTELLQQQGATVIEMPTLEIGAPTSWEGLDQAIANLSDFNWIVFSSTNGVEAFFERLAVQHKDTRSLAHLKIAVVGKKTAASLQQHHLIPDFIPPDFIADSLVAHFPDSLPGQKILFPRVESGGREVLVKEMTAKGSEVVEVAAYESRCPDAISASALAALKQQQIDMITFASSKTVRNFHHLLEAAGGADLTSVKIASIGPQTSQACYQLFGRVDIEAIEYTLEGLVQALIQAQT